MPGKRTQGNEGSYSKSYLSYKDDTPEGGKSRQSMRGSGNTLGTPSPKGTKQSKGANNVPKPTDGPKMNKPIKDFDDKQKKVTTLQAKKYGKSGSQPKGSADKQSNDEKSPGNAFKKHKKERNLNSGSYF